MRILLDTHIFLWLIIADSRLSRTARQLIADGQNELLLSAASAWEFAIKVRSGKLTITEPPDTYLRRFLTLYRVATFPVDVDHALQTYQLPLHHRDPFDRLLVAQAIHENLPIMSNDRNIRKYDVDVIW